jgi:hypothetical protein
LNPKVVVKESVAWLRFYQKQFSIFKSPSNTYHHPQQGLLNEDKNLVLLPRSGHLSDLTGGGFIQKFVFESLFLRIVLFMERKYVGGSRKNQRRRLFFYFIIACNYIRLKKCNTL